MKKYKFDYIRLVVYRVTEITPSFLSFHSQALNYILEIWI